MELKRHALKTEDLHARTVRMMRAGVLDVLQALDHCSSRTRRKDIHQLRLGARSLLATLGLLSVMHKDGRDIRRAAHALKVILRATSGLRDLQLHRAHINSASLGRQGAWLADELDDRIARSSSRALRLLAGVDRSSLVLLAGRAWKQPGIEDARRRMRKHLERERTEIAALLKNLDPDDERSLHDHRIALKHHRSTLLVLGEAVPAEIQRMLKDLGAWHDACVRIDQLAVLRKRAPRKQRRWIDHQLPGSRTALQRRAASLCRSARARS